jgi:predicted kinase
MGKTKEFVMLVGLPYSGKSTLIQTSNLRDYTLVSSDAEVQAYAKSLGKTYNDVFKDYIDQAMANAQKTMQDAFREGKNVVLDQTNLTVASRRKKLAQVPKDYRRTCIVVEAPSKEELDKRIEERTSHRIPNFVLDNMRKMYQYPTLDEGFDVIYNSSFDDIFITK